MATYVWDGAKRETNLKKHGIDFIGAERIFEGYTATVEDQRWRYGEQRFVTFGILDGRLVAVAHTERNEVIRIISIRRATNSEERSYVSTLTD